MTKTVWRVCRAALAERANIYHFHDSELILVGLLLGLRGKRVIYDVHDDLPRQVLSKRYLPPQLRGLVSGATEKVEDFAAPRFSALVAATLHIAERFRSLNCRTVAVQNFSLLDELVAGEDGIS